MGGALDSVLASAYPHDRLEVLVVDGMSGNGMRAALAEYASRHPEVRMLGNPRGTTPGALNMGIAAARGAMIVYLPLYIFCGEHLLRARLRPSVIDASAGALGEVERIVAQIRARWPQVRIVLRADSGFAREAIMAWCEASDVDYVFGLAKNARLNRVLGRELRRTKLECDRTGKPVRVFKNFAYKTRKTWSRQRRVVGKAEHLPDMSNPRFVVTSLSLEEWTPQALYEDLYCARGDMENRIKEQQLYLLADRTSAATIRHSVTPSGSSS